MATGEGVPFHSMSSRGLPDRYSGCQSSGKTLSKEQLDNWVNQNNSNSKAYKANQNDHANQLNSKRKTHSQIYNV